MIEYIKLLAKCIKENKTLTDKKGMDELDKKEDFYFGMAQKLFDGFKMNAESFFQLKYELENLGLKVEKVSADNFNRGVKGPAEYLNIDGKKVIIGPYLEPIMYDKN